MPFKDRNKQRAAQATYQRTKVQNLRAEFIALKEADPCLDCGVSYPYYVMEYDHVRGEKKERLNRLVARGARKAAYEELEKCELVCANCHRVRTQERMTNIAS